ncbi:patatin family protein [Vibrio sp. SM6]|uniref:Patatin family protein n=1 Tax=Vibrio agarilyticus TaxID=2726741 RepID=A0A7X8TMX0_9VIBR|nr:patatin-like phospholipase family protein [Vibrio agarilyticus]NLS11494.1 patatin family protein [Vibrio agarilyticus]
MVVNSGVVTEQTTLVNRERFAGYLEGKTALVTQGGGQRGIFTAGVLDAFLLANVDPFDEFYGTSAGALNLCAYLCRQLGLAKSFILDLTTTPEFFSLFSYIRRKQFLGMDWALTQIQQFPYKIDLDLGRMTLGQRGAFAAVTDVDTLSDHYLPLLTQQWFETLLATCAIPRLYEHEVELNGQRFVDGGVSASIPVQEAWRRNARLIVVVRTEPIEVPGPKPTSNDLNDEIPAWFKEPLQGVQEKWQQTLLQWRQGWSSFIQQQFIQAQQNEPYAPQLNGGRWLFGADNIYRLSHLLGEKFDASLADMLMVHYQTYDLTQTFLRQPPDDTFVVQIAPSSPLRSSSLMSTAEELLHDYQLGLEAGQRFITLYHSMLTSSAAARSA